MKKVITFALIMFGLFIFIGVKVSNSQSENNNVSQSIVRPVSPKHPKNRVTINQNSGSDTTPTYHHHAKLQQNDNDVSPNAEE